jgi:hypothetical protein
VLEAIDAIQSRVRDGAGKGDFREFDRVPLEYSSKLLRESLSREFGILRVSAFAI